MAVEASCEVWINDELVACERDDLAAGLPTVLDDLSIGWGRQSVWDQPDPGTISFRLQDQRTSPQALESIVHAGAKVDVWASAPNPNPVPFQYMREDFSGFFGGGGRMFDSDWLLWPRLAGSTLRTNLMTDPSMTTTTGKTAGGSAVLAVSSDWAQAGTTSISVTPNGVSNASAVFPLGGTGMSAFTAGQTYTISCYIRITAVQTGTLDANARRIRIHQSTGGASSVVATSAAAPNTIGVHRLSVTYAVPANATQLVFSVMNGSSVAAQVMWVDAVLITQTATLSDYFDGTTTKTGYAYAWTGTANASTSTERYAATDPNAAPYRTTNPPVGEGSASGFLNTLGTRAAFEFPPEEWGAPWPRDPGRAMEPGETWSWSIMTRTPAGTSLTLSFFSRTSSTSSEIPGSLLINGGTGELVINGTGGWVTTTGTVTNILTRSVWPTFLVTVNTPEAYNLAASMPTVDALTLTAPAQAENRVLVFSGRASDVEVEPGPRQVIELSVTGAGAAADVENVSVGDTPWPGESVTARLARIAAAIPAPLNSEFSLSYDPIVGFGSGPVIERDVDKQPALDLIRDYADDGFGVAWPINHPGGRNHVWVESLSLRTGIWSGPAAEVSACDIPKLSFRVTQSTADVITVIDVTYQNLTGDGYVATTVTDIDETAAATYGMRRLAIDTQISTSVGALWLAGEAMAFARASSWTLEGVAFDTRNMDGTGTGAHDLVLQLLGSATRPGSKITITDLPEWVPMDAATGFVEGGTISYRSGRWHFELNMSAAPSGS